MIATVLPAATVHAALNASRRAYDAQPFINVLSETAETYRIAAGAVSFAQAWSRVEKLREEYRSAGLSYGQRVGLLLENRPEFLLHWFALNGLGVSVVPINPDWRAAELEYLIGHSEIVLAVALESHQDSLRAAALAVDRAVVVTDPQLTQLERLAASTASTAQVPGAATECALLYTSGTTGRSKACVLPNEYFLWAGQWYAAIGGLCEVRPGAEHMLSPLPLGHMNAMAYSTMCMLLTGGCLTLLDRFHPRGWWLSVRESRASIVHYLGVMPAMLLSAPESPRDRDHQVRFGFGAGVSVRHHLAFEQRFGFPLLEAWAMTETGAGAVMIANREPRKVGTACFGLAEPCVEYRVVGDDGNPVGLNHPGELLVRHRGTDPTFGFFKGYLKEEQATQDAWRDGFFHTGDVVYEDADRQLHFVDRKKNVIRRSGENVSAVEIECVLVQHPAVAAAGVVPVPDAVRGDEIMACIVLRGGDEDGAAQAHDIVSFCLARLAYFKAPGYVAFLESLPLTPTEKIQRAKLREAALTALESGNVFDTRTMKKRQDPQ